jgi:gamma-glutamyltranspeptidase/glutathione hydrolase
VIDHSMNIADATDQPRLHHQWLPDVLELEAGFSPDTIRLLQARGHTLKTGARSMGSLQTVALKDGLFRGASDTRRPHAGATAPAEVDDRR